MIKISNELAIVAVAMVIFYLRMAMLRGRKRRLARQEALAASKKKESKSGVQALSSPVQGPTIQVTSWYLVAIAMILMCLGVALYSSGWFPAYKQYWWVAVTIGVILFTFCFK